MPDISHSNLFQQCAEEPSDAVWTEFLLRYEKLISITAHRVARQWLSNPTPDDVSDLVQNTILKFFEDDCRALKRFQQRGPDSDFAFIKVFTLHATIDHFKKLGTKKRAGRVGPIDGAINIPDTASSGDSIGHKVLIREIDDLLRVVLPKENKERDILVFWLYYKFGLTAQAIGDFPSIDLTTKGVESLLYRLTRLIREKFANKFTE